VKNGCLFNAVLFSPQRLFQGFQIVFHFLDIRFRGIFRAEGGHEGLKTFSRLDEIHQRMLSGLIEPVKS
jgi:hypothetical protein